MNRIRLLSENVANQIAAGEVIERPASVVKELVENAVDAGALNILVEVQAGGRSLVRVTDDGIGMSKDDALLSLERHATSKIQTAHDLSAISTFGFRGEALPSIASVSRFTLTTRERSSDKPDASQVVVHGGKIMEVCSAAGPSGTCVEVRQLFYNLPARRKFLRTEETENAHITHYLTLVGLAHPAVGLTYLQDQRLVWQLPGARIEKETDRFEALRDRLRSLLGGELEMVRVESERPMSLKYGLGSGISATESDLELREEGEERGGQGRARVWGYIGAPGVSRSSREDQHIFVNSRPVEHRGLNFALAEGYHTALMKGRFPVCCLFLEVPPSEVDVNVHPSKKEVRFHQDQFLRRFLSDSIRQALVNYHLRSSEARKETLGNPPEVQRPNSQGSGLVTDTERPRELFPSVEPESGVRTQTTDLATSAARVAAQLPRFEISPAPIPASRDRKIPLGRGATPVSGGTAGGGEGGVVQPVGAGGAGAIAASEPVRVKLEGPRPLLSVPLRLVGVVGRLYVVLESDRGLVLLDQHAAHERVLFEQMLRRLEQGNAPSQRLLLAETVEVSARDAQFLRSQISVLNRLGVGLSEFGERTFLLDALPPFVKAPDARRFVLDVVDHLKEVGEGVNTLRLGEDVVAKTVCRHAVKANDPLGGAELENLIEDLKGCVMPYTCPHGRPTLIEMNYRELERKFGRTQ